MSPHTEGRKQAPITLIKQWKEKGETGKAKQPLSGVPALETQILNQNGEQVKGRFQKISIPIPWTAFRISEGEGGSQLWNSEVMGVFMVGNPKAWGDFTGGISGVEGEFFENAILGMFALVVRK